MALVVKILLFSICFISVYSNEYVPVYMWETSKNYSPLPALGRINEEFFRDILLDKISKDKIILVFLEKNLSPEDFSTLDSTGNNVFGSLSHHSQDNDIQVNYYAFVENPLKAVESLPGIKVLKGQVNDDGLVDGTEVKPGQVLIIDLNDATENEGRSQMLSRHDKLMSSVYKSIAAEHNNIISLYTAIHSSWLVPSEMDDNEFGRKARHLMAASEEKKEMIIKDLKYTLIYTSGPIILNANETYAYTDCKDPKESSETDVTLTCSQNSSTTSELIFSFESDLGYWYLQSINTTVNSEVISITIKDVFAPFGFSYHCNKAKYVNEFRPDKADPNKIITYTILLPDFQVQRFLNSSKPNSFSDAYDCIGFTTAPIWSGLFVTFILAMIMTFGLCMIMDIKTMDRFDDPKGKTISISVVD